MTAVESRMPPPPLTDEDLARFENTSRDLHEGRAPVPALAAASQAGLVPILIAEVRRLRSDEWLERAADEIYEASLHYMDADEALAILRKHRDGKA